MALHTLVSPSKIGRWVLLELKWTSISVFVNNQLEAQFFFHVCLFLFSTCFGAGMCPSSGELIVSIRHLVYVTLHRWPFGVQVRMKLIQNKASVHNSVATVEYSKWRYTLWCLPLDWALVITVTKMNQYFCLCK